MKEKVDLIFGQNLNEESLNFYKEELVFWHSQNSETLEFSKKEIFANQILNQMRRVLEIKNNETELVVRFSSDLTNQFNFFEAKDITDIFDSLKSFVNHTAHVTKSTEVLVELARLTLKMNISRRRIGKEFEGSLQDFAHSYKNKMESNFFNSAQCHYTTNTEGVEMIFVFENRHKLIESKSTVKSQTDKNIKMKTREKQYEI